MTSSLEPTANMPESTITRRLSTFKIKHTAKNTKEITQNKNSNRKILTNKSKRKSSTNKSDVTLESKPGKIIKSQPKISVNKPLKNHSKNNHHKEITCEKSDVKSIHNAINVDSKVSIWIPERV